MTAEASLRDSELFAHFDPVDVDSLLAATSRRAIALGDPLDGGQACFVGRGRATVRRDTPYGPYLLRRVGAGELLGEGHLLQQPPGEADILAEADLEVLVDVERRSRRRTAQPVRSTFRPIRPPIR